MEPRKRYLDDGMPRYENNNKDKIDSGDFGGGGMETLLSRLCHVIQDAGSALH